MPLLHVLQHSKRPVLVDSMHALRFHADLATMKADIPTLRKPDILTLQRQFIISLHQLKTSLGCLSHLRRFPPHPLPAVLLR